MELKQGQFSQREKEVIELLLQGKSNKQIAFELHIAQSTVEYHLKNIYQKLGVNSRTEAVIRLGKSISNDSPSGSETSTIGIEGKEIGKSTMIGILLAIVLIALLIFFITSAQRIPDVVLPLLVEGVFVEGNDPNCVFFSCHSLLGHLIDPITGENNPKQLEVSLPDDPAELYAFLKQIKNDHPQETFYLISVFYMTINRAPRIPSGHENSLPNLISIFEKTINREPGSPLTPISDQNDILNLLRQTDPVYQDYLDDIEKLNRIRENNPALKGNSLIPLDTIATIIAYARLHEDQTIIVVLNNSADEQPITIDLGSKEISCSNATNPLTENDQTIQLENPGTDDTSLSVTLYAWEPKIIECK